MNHYAGWQRSTVVALTLAELYYQALIKEEPSNPADEDNKSNAKRAAKASSSRIDQLMASCMAHMGMFEAVLLQQQANTSASASYSHIIQSSSDSAVALTLELSSQDNTAALSTSDDAPATASHKHDADVYQLLARYHWLGGCLSEHLKHFEDASQQYEACKVALAVLSSSCDTAQATSFTLARGVTISAPLVESRLETLKMVMIVEDGRRCLDEGRHEELVSRLTPVLLTANTSHLPLNVPQQLAGLDLIKVVCFICPAHKLARHGGTFTFIARVLNLTQLIWLRVIQALPVCCDLQQASAMHMWPVGVDSLLPAGKGMLRLVVKQSSYLQYRI